MPEHPDFEGELIQALRRVGTTFEPDQHQLTLGGAVRGRRMRRRRAFTVTGAAAAAGLLLVGTVAVAGLPGDGARAVPPASTASPSAPAPVGMTADQLVTALAQQVGMRVVGSEAIGTADALRTGKPLVVSITVDDGMGRGLVSLHVDRRPTDGSLPKTDCVSDPAAGETCHEYQALQGAVTLRQSKPPGGDPRRTSSAALIAPDGLSVTVSTYNMANMIDQQITRAQAPVPLTVLGHIASDPVWRPAVEGFPADGRRPIQQPMLSEERLTAVVRQQLPAGATVDQVRPGPDGLHLRVNSGGVDVILRDWRTPPMGTSAAEFAGANHGADGSLMLVEGGPYSGSSFRNVVHLLTPARLRVTVSALSPPHVEGQPPTDTPVLTSSQLRAVAVAVANEAKLP
jgi:hypothetical protein